jgi:hypothetical protein
VFGVRDVARATSLTPNTVYAASPRTSNLLQHQDNTPHCCKPQSYAPEDGQKICPKHVELIQRSIKLLLLHLVGHLYYSPKNYFNPLTPNDHFSGRTAPLTSRCCILYIYSTNISTEYFKHAAYFPFFPLQNVVYFIMLPFLVPVLFTFYIQVC